MTRLGPSDNGRSRTAESLLPAAKAAALEAGVTRLANVTRLDRIGLPVWQSVRPLGRALSVHQGKGATNDDARIGALLEAVESHHAESFDEPGPVCRFDALPQRERAPFLSDFAEDRANSPDSESKYRWVRTRTVTGDALHLPFDLVSLDFTRGLDSRFDRESNGVATGATREEAISVALLELIERDAVAEWERHGFRSAVADCLALDSVPFEWLGYLRERIASADVLLRVFRVPSIVGIPVFATELNDLQTERGAYRANQGRGCHADPEIALFRSIAEAIQGRTTYIAGAREDLLPEAYSISTRGTVSVAFGVPPPPSIAAVKWESVDAGPECIVAALERAGYDRIAVVDLGRPHGFSIVRAFVCGLGSMTRQRRPRR